ncbi:tyrosine-type recombinase/integrase [Nocardioides speluncae]|uniref:tyrosine-type recombinase/integrase n=1 Tax=Nocardioides speluncae TaxID=2670337 RepID=UPI000D69BBDC|nr:site-specific integrase [Nocardioides speluncae]
MSGRRRGKGSITSYKTKGGTRWRWQIRVPIDPDQPELGTKPHGQGGYLTSGDADDALQEALRKRREQLRFGSTVPTLGAYAEEWLKGLKIADSTRKGYAKNVRNHITPYLGDIRLDKLTATRIARHYRELEDHGRKDTYGMGKPLSPNTVSKVHVNLCSILDAAIEDGHVNVNQAKKKLTTKPPTSSEIREHKPEIVTWSREQLDTFLAWDRDVLKDELYALWQVIAWTGMRRSEALALRWSDVNAANRQIQIRRATNTVDWSKTKKTKTRKARAVDIDEMTAKVLAAHKKVRAEISFELAKADAFVFGDDSGLQRSPDAMTSRWDRRLKWVGEAHPEIHRVTLKGLRHTHATLLLEAGEHPKVVQERLGHSTITITMDIYSHVTPTMQRSAIDRLAGGSPRA